MSETRRPDRAVMATGEGERVGDWQTEAATSRSAPPDGEAATPDALGVALDRVLQVTTDLARAMATVIEGKDDVIRTALVALLAEGHLLVEDVPGVGKTMLAKTLARSVDATVRRVQFTPDLLPSDITGVSVWNQDLRSFEFRPGAIFANVVVGDEINRASPKTQSALLESMEEAQVTVDGTTYALPRPFMVMATQNPIEMEGTYPLPEAQLDRFMFNIVIGYLGEDDEVEVVRRTTGAPGAPVDTIFTGEDLLQCHQLIRRVPVSEEVLRYAVKLASATRPGQPNAPEFIENWVEWGAGTRAAQFLILGAKTRALLHNRAHASFDDVRALAHPVLRHRILINYKAEAEGVTMEQVIDRVIESVDQKH